MSQIYHAIVKVEKDLARIFIDCLPESLPSEELSPEKYGYETLI